MKDIYKNPILYYIAVPAIVALWPLLVWTVYLPASEHRLTDEINQCKKAQQIMLEILRLDPSRLVLADSNAPSEEFDYARAVQRVASLYEISPANYKLSSGIIIKSGGQKSQSATVSLKDIGIDKFANFLSTIQRHWSNLQCKRLKLTKKKSPPPNIWDIDIEFKYYY
jgi:hypothetical protein